MQGYDHRKIEKKWQKKWAEDGLYTTPDVAKDRDNFYLLVEFPYPSGNLHVGHWYAFAVPDILARMLRMKGKNVLYPIGFDAFGLPAENAAIKNKLNPRDWTERNIAHMTKQMESMGTTFDWSRAVSTIDPKYYRWTQWQFLQFFKKGLAYQKETAVNWCPTDKTVLANEQVVDGKCERCGADVVQKMMLQWNIKITDYADRLIDDLEKLDWPEQIKEAERNWIGRSEGAEIDFPLAFEGGKKYKYVLLHGYTARPSDKRLQWLKVELEKMGHEVVIPELPNTDDPSEEEQVAVALKATDYNENTVVFGHSLGGTVALKLLEKLKSPVFRLVLAGAVVSPDFKDKRRPFEKKFNWTFDAEKIKANAKGVTLLHDPRDYAITEEQRATLEKMLDTKAELCRSTEPHFLGEREPDLLMWLRPTIRVYTTRADTLFGGTYLVLAPEHRWVKLALQHKTVLKNNDEVAAYVEQAQRKTELERQSDQKEKTGVELKGVHALNPATGEAIPLWVADFVIGTYGTGAVFADAHDERDFAFAKKYGIPLKETLEPLISKTNGLDAFRVGEPSDDRNSVMAIVKHWKDDTYLAQTYKPTQVHGFVTGGVEAGEDAIAAGIREIAEETGYTGAEFVESLGRTIHSKYYSVKYKKNLLVHYTPLVFRLKDGAMVDMSPEEKADHECQWLTRDEMVAFIDREDMRIAWERVQGDVCYPGKGILFDSGEFSGMTSEEAIPKVGEKFGRRTKQYRLRDWIVSRQRYWGVPIPIIHCKKCGVQPVPDEELPVILPELDDYLPEGSGKSPLAKAKDWVAVSCPSCGGNAERETDTLDTFVDSSWYFLRYTDPQNDKEFASREKQDHWMPIDLYSGGAEHTTMHLLYSRFWHKALFDLGLVGDSEPYVHRENHGLILGPDGQKMSKSKGNVVDPDEVVERLGADTVRMYLAFMGPYTGGASYPWNPNGVVGIRRFLERVCKLPDIVGDEDNEHMEQILHKTIKKVGDDIEALKFNTAISQLMILLNNIEAEKRLGHRQMRIFLRLLSVFSPHLADELWERAGGKGSVHGEPWPEYDSLKLTERTLHIAVQVDGKTRAEIEVDAEADKAVIEAAAREAVAPRLIGKIVDRVIIVPGRLVNFVLTE